VTTTPTVDVIGLRALLRDANRLCADAGPLNAALSQAGKTAAAPVAEQARGDYPEVSGDLAGSVRVTGTRSGAAVRVGRASVPYAGPYDFGGWPKGRQFIPTGRVLWPAASQLASEAATLYSEAAQHAFDSFGWTNEGNEPHD
jgi:hypothetical protein